MIPMFSESLIQIQPYDSVENITKKYGIKKGEGACILVMWNLPFAHLQHSAYFPLCHGEPVQPSILPSVT